MITSLVLFCIVVKDALQEQRYALAAAMNSAVAESSPTGENLPSEKVDEIYEPLGINIQQLPPEGASGLGVDQPFTDLEYQVETTEGGNNVEERQFIANFISMSPMHRTQEEDSERRNLSALINSSDEDLSVSLHLGDREHKRQRSDPALSLDLQK